MSRRIQPFGGPCHDGEEWTCLGCERVQCRRCDGAPGDETLCWACANQEDPESAA